MNLERVDLNLLTHLDVLLREKNVTRAAEQLGVTQPAMSNILRRLRVLFNDPLLIRSSEGMTATERAETSHYFQQQAQKQVNTALTLRNWLIGCYLFEYEQNGQDRATYGENLYKKLAEHLLKSGIKGTSRSNLHLFRQFYLAYPTIVQTVSGQLQLSDFPVQEILKLANKQQ
jgi:hypothetical protein